MSSRKIISSTFLALTAFAAVSVHASEPAVEPTEAQRKAIVALTAELDSFVITMSRPVWAFHWSSATGQGVPSIDRIDLHSPTMVNLGKRLAHFFWTNTDTETEELVGRGMYAARDPIASSDFAGQNGTWVLGVVEIPTGSRFIDVRATLPWHPSDNSDYTRGNRLAMRPEALALVQAAGCEVKRYSMMASWTTLPPCTYLLRAALKNLKVEGTVHHWWNASLHGCFEESPTFTLFNPDMFTRRNVTTFTVRSPELIIPGTRESRIAAFVYALSLEAKARQAEDSQREGWAQASPTVITEGWQQHDAQIRSYAPELFEAAGLQGMKDERIFNCSQRYPEEPVRQAYAFLGLPEPTPESEAARMESIYGPQDRGIFMDEEEGGEWKGSRGNFLHRTIRQLKHLFKRHHASK